jgi:hypothetical protein
MAFSHIDGRLVATPDVGPNAGKDFEFQGGSKVGIDPGVTYDVASGRRQRPIYVITKAAKPKISLENVSARELHRWWKFYTGGGPPIRGGTARYSHTFSRPGVGVENWRMLKCPVPPAGFDSDDSGVKGKLEFPCEDIHLDGVTIYEDK